MIEIRIAKPCDQTWTAMKGDAQVRHCLGCRKNVYNIAEMTELEVAELVRRTEGKFCARIYRRTDGRVLTKDCPRGVARVRRRRTLAVTAAMTAVAGLVWPVAAQRSSGAAIATHRRTSETNSGGATLGKIAAPVRVEMGAPAVASVRMGDGVIVPERQHR